ncbi:MAG: protein kinase [Planctomycetales bacterium]|nr:protein kinase [Planctomycetales bacterium]
MIDGDDEDGWIADFLDWLDMSSDSKPLPACADKRVECFLENCGRTAPAEIKKILLAFAAVDHPIGDIAANATLDWIDSGCHHDEPALPMPFGDYRLLEVIGRGGMGIVYRATQVSLDRPVCIKLAPVGMDHRARLVREAKLAGELHHPNIIAVFDAGVWDGRSYIAMEYVDGQTLSAMLASSPMDSRTAATLLDQICAAVAFAHEKKILHRDLKPSNVMLDRSGRPRVADFGLAKRLQPARQSTTETLTGIAGSPSYMAPEQVRDDELTVRTDVYGLGAMLYEMISGRPPLVGNTPLETMRLVESTEPVELGRLQVGLPKDLETICHKCLEKRPHNRYATVNALRDDLQRFLDDVPVFARPTGRVVRAARWAKRNPSISIAAAVVIMSLVATLAIGGWMLSQTRQALAKTTAAEAKQRALAEQLGEAVVTTNIALFRSQIMQASQSLSAKDVASARRALSEIYSAPDLRSLAGIEFDALWMQAWPGITIIDSDGARIIDWDWNDTSQTLVVITESGTIETYSHDGTRVGETKKLILDPSSRSVLLRAHPNRDLIAVASGSQIEWFGIKSISDGGVIALAEPVVEMHWHPTTNHLIVKTVSNELLLVDTTSRRLMPVMGLRSSYRKMAISGDGVWLAMMTSKQTDLWTWSRIESAAGQRTTAPSEPDHAITNRDWLVDQVWSGNHHLTVLDESGAVTTFEVDQQPDGGIRDRIEWSIESGLQRPTGLQISRDQLCIMGANQTMAVDNVAGKVLWRQVMIEHTAVKPDRSSSLIAVQEIGSNHIEIWDSDRLATPRVIESSGVPVRRVSIGNKGQSIAWRDVDGGITARNQAWNQKLVEFTETAQPGTGIAISPTDDLIAVGRESELIVYRIPEMAEAVRVSEHQSTLWSMAFDHSGQLIASGDSDGVVLVVDTTTGKVRHRYDGFQNDIRAIVFSPNGKRLVVADGSKRIKCCDLESGVTNTLDPIESTTINAVAVIDDRSIAVADSLGKISVLDLNEKRMTTSWAAHTGPVWSLQRSGDRILSAGQDGTVRVWDLAGNLLLVLADLHEPIWSIDHDAVTRRLCGSTTSGNVFTLDY